MEFCIFQIRNLFFCRFAFTFSRISLANFNLLFFPVNSASLKTAKFIVKTCLLFKNFASIFSQFLRLHRPGFSSIFIQSKHEFEEVGGSHWPEECTQCPRRRIGHGLSEEIRSTGVGALRSAANFLEMAVDASLASLYEKLKLEDPWLPPRTWEFIPSQSGNIVHPRAGDRSLRPSLFDVKTVSVSSPVSIFFFLKLKCVLLSVLW